MRTYQLTTVMSFAMLFLFACGQSQTTTSDSSTPNSAVAVNNGNPNEVFDGNTITKSDAEWKAELSPEVYYITRQEGTERAFTNPLNNNKKKGVYYCIACGLPLFASDTKFDSGTGWPSFFQPINDKNLDSEELNDMGYEYKEVHCARCGGHMGHVFNDAPSQPTGLRYCINGAALHFEE